MLLTPGVISSMRPEILYDCDAEVAAWVFNQLPYAPHNLAMLPKDWYCAYGIVRNGRLIAGVVWHDLQANLGDVQISIVGSGPWITKDIANIITSTPFERFGVAHCTARHAASNVKATVGIQRLGWIFEGRQSLAWNGKEDALLFGLTKARSQTWAAQSAAFSAPERRAKAKAAVLTPFRMIQ